MIVTRKTQHRPPVGIVRRQKGTKIMNTYAIVIDGKTVDRITAEDAESAARAYSAKQGPDSDFGFVRGVKMVDADTRGSRWAIIKADGGDITAERI